jgi:alpha-ribazole phosphatase
MPVRLILIRHGQTIWNQQKKYCGYANVPLSPEGRRQVRHLAQRLNKEEIHKIYSSDRQRAIETAKIIFKGRKIKQIPDLKEMGFGVFEGLTYQEILKKYPVVYKKWLKDPYSVRIPKGEKLNDLKKRVVSTLKKIVSLNKNRTVAIVTHGGAISIFINHIESSKRFWDYVPKSASITIIEYKVSKARIRLFDDASHLLNTFPTHKMR